MPTFAIRLSDPRIALGLTPHPRARRSSGMSRAWTPLALVVLVATGLAGGTGPASAQAAVFTDLSLPTITGTAVEGETLSETHATWSAPPTSYYDQWQRCNSSGNKCESIEKATKQTYRLTAKDVGFTIRISESASNAEGAVTPALSEPTAVIQASTTGGHGGGSGGGPSGGGVPPPVSCCAPAHRGSPEIKTILARQLAPSSRVSMSALLRAWGPTHELHLPRGWHADSQVVFPAHRSQACQQNSGQANAGSCGSN